MKRFRRTEQGTTYWTVGGRKSADYIDFIDDFDTYRGWMWKKHIPAFIEWLQAVYNEHRKQKRGKDD